MFVFQNQDLKEFCNKSSPKLEVSYVSRYLWSVKRNTALRRKVSKFCEAFWRFIFYFSFVVIGCKVLLFPSPVSWILDTKNHWIDWPFHPLSKMLSFYYHVQLGCYMHQLMWTEVKRSDSIEMILHHFTTILLLVISYLTNFTRIGSSILLVHDIADVFLESGKLFNYAAQNNKNRFGSVCQVICDSFFVMFAVTFFVTRLVIYPRYIIASVLWEAPAFFGVQWSGYWAFAILLLTLQALHIFWFYLIAKMVFKLVATGIEQDERSDVDDVSEEFLEDETDNTNSAKKKDKRNRSDLLCVCCSFYI